MEDNKNQEVVETEVTEVEVEKTETKEVEEVKATKEKEYSTEENTEEQEEEKSEEQEETKETETKEEEVEATEETEVKEEEVEESSEEETEESSEETSEEEVKEEVKEEFSKTEDKGHSMSTSQLFKEIEKELDKVTETFDYWWSDEPFEAPSFWKMDVLFDKQVVIAYEEATGDIYGLPYVVKGDEVKIDFTMKKPYVTEWREKVIEEETLNFSNVRQTNEGVKVAFEKLKEEKQELVKYKVEAEVEEVLNKFSLTEEEIASEKERVLKGEYSIETFTDKLCILEGRKKLESKANFSKKEKAKNIPIASTTDTAKEEKMKSCPFPTLANSLI